MSEKMYKRALKYKERGWIIVPLSSPKSNKETAGKKPIRKRWTTWSKTKKSNLRDWFLETDNNIGVQCGKRSGITAIDFDSYLFRDELFEGIEINTLHSEHKEGRGHYLFKYTPDLKSINRYLLGFEIKNDGRQIAVPPSIHKDKTKYKWEDKEAPLQKMPKKLIERINTLVETEQNLNTIISKCRSWILSIWKSVSDKKLRKLGKLDIHDENAMLAISAEMKFNNCTKEEFQMFAKIMLDDDYDEKYTSKKWKYVKPMTWTFHRLKSVLPSHLQKCVVHEKHRELNPEAVDYEIENRAILYEQKYYIQEDKKTKDVYFNDRKTHDEVAKLRFDKESLKYFDDNFRDEGVTKEVNEYNSAFFAYYLKELKENGIPVGIRWEYSTKTCQTRTYKRMVQDYLAKSWVTEYFVVCRTMDNGEWKICKEYVPKFSYLSPEVKKSKIINMYRQGIPTKTLADIFGYRSPRMIQLLVKDIRLKCKLK